MSEVPIGKDGYINIGTNSDFIDVEIGMEHANAFRAIVVSELLEPLAFKTKKLGLTKEEETDTTYQHYRAFNGVGSRAILNADYVHEPSVFVGAILTQPADDMWHLTLVRNRNSFTDEGLSEERIRNIYKIICWGNQVMEAKHTIKSIRSIPRLVGVMQAFEEDTDVPIQEYERTSLSSPLKPEDCDVVSTFLAQHVSRVKKERGL